MYPSYVSKLNPIRDQQVVILMIPNGEKSKANSDGKWNSLAFKRSGLLRRITSKHHGDFYCLNCLSCFVTEKKLESHKNLCENKDFCNVIKPSEDTKILEFNQYQIFDKAPFIIYADPECIIEKIDGYKNNPENSSTTKVSEHIPSVSSLSTISSFRSIENQHDVYRSKDRIKMFWESSWKHAIKMINFKKEENEIVNKRAAGIIWKSKNLLYL